jgi:hypothetical protein
MSDLHLPAEMLDHIVDHLRDADDALKSCCLVSKSWIPRTRKYLFAYVGLTAVEVLQSWKETFPDPLTSPACYVKYLLVECSEVITAADADAGGWITGFSHVEKVALHDQILFASGASTLSLFHGFSPIKSLNVTSADLPPPRVFNLILSFPLLEDLAVYSTHGISADDDDEDRSDRLSTIVQPSNTPVFTGSLEIVLGPGGMKPFTHWLLSLPGGLHFRKLTLRWFQEEDLSLVEALVEACSHTLESLDITDSPGTSIRHLLLHHSLPSLVVNSSLPTIDLSKATKLKDVVFEPNSWRFEWIATALQTITPEHQDFRQISIRTAYYQVIDGAGTDANAGQTTGGLQRCSSLDQILLQFWELRSIQPKVIYTERGVRDCIRRLLPEMTERWIIDLVKCAPE